MPETTAKHATPDAVSPADAMRLLHAVRDRLVDAAANAYAEHLKDARLDLQQLADRAADSTRREIYEAGHALLANGGLGLLRRFRDTYCRACDHAIGVLRGTERDAWEGVEELSLLDATVFERDLAIARLSAKAAYACSQQLTALDRRVAALLGLRRMDGEGNPFGVKRLFSAFVDAAEANWSGAQLSLTLLETFEHYTAERLPEIYRALNQYLVDNGVLPKLPVELDEREHELDRAHRGGGEAVGDVFVQLTSGLMGRRGAGGDGRLAGGWGGGVPGGYPAGGYPPGGQPQGGGAAAGPMGAGGDPTGGQMAPMVLSQLLDGLTGLQRGNAGAAAKLGIDADSIGAADSAVLRSLGASPLLRWLQPNDAVTIELVAMLFDCIFSDAEVPESLRAAIGKLQVPVLKVALMNKGFFSDRRHPARRLLDVMAAAARGWGQQDEQALLARIRAAVDNVLAGFEQDTSVFDAEVADIEGILREAERAARGQVGELVQRLEQRDRRAVADAVVSDQIERRLNEAGPVPAPVAAFVDSHWRELLGRIYVRFGDGGEDWRAALGSLEDLLWSVQPKALPEARQRLTQLLPELLERLPAGLARIGRAAAWEPFLADLMPLHMAAIRTPPPRDESDAAPGESVGSPGAVHRDAELTASGRPADAMPPADSEGLPWMLDSETSASQDDAPAAPDGVATAAMPASAPISSAAAAEPEHEPEPGIESGSEALPGHADTASRDPWLEAARGVAVGDWLEVAQLGGANLSLRATWLSRQSGLMLFADRRGRNARVLSAERLATALRDGNARLLSRDPLTDRAVARLLVSAAPAEQTAA